MAPLTSVLTTSEVHAPALRVQQYTTTQAAVPTAAHIAAAVAVVLHSAEAAAVVHSVEAAVAVHSAEAVAVVLAAPAAEVLEAVATAVAVMEAAAEAAVRSAVGVKTRTSAFIIRCTSRIVQPA